MTGTTRWRSRRVWSWPTNATRKPMHDWLTRASKCYRSPRRSSAPDAVGHAACRAPLLATCCSSQATSLSQGLAHSIHDGPHRTSIDDEDLEPSQALNPFLTLNRLHCHDVDALAVAHAHLDVGPAHTEFGGGVPVLQQDAGLRTWQPGVVKTQAQFGFLGRPCAAIHQGQRRPCPGHPARTAIALFEWPHQIQADSGDRGKAIENDDGGVARKMSPKVKCGARGRRNGHPANGLDLVRLDPLVTDDHPRLRPAMV